MKVFLACLAASFLSFVSLVLVLKLNDRFNFIKDDSTVSAMVVIVGLSCVLASLTVWAFSGTFGL